MRRVVQRYGRRLPVLEVWNEENMSSCWKNQNPTNCLSLLRRTCETVKKVDPGIRASLGGTAGGAGRALWQEAHDTRVRGRYESIQSGKIAKER